MPSRLSVADALNAVLDGVHPLEPEKSPLFEAAGRCLAENVSADRDQPAFNRSMMDGFAVRSADVQDTPVTLRVVGEVAAGHMGEMTLDHGEAVRIMTGAPVPDGADAVQMIENTSSADRNTVTLNKSVKLGQNISAQGEEVKAGDVAVPAGSYLTTARLGVCWSVGAEYVSVFREPRVAVLTTGDELVELTETPGPCQIRDSNRAVIGDLVTRAGGVVTQASIIKDDIGAIRRAVNSALNTCDVLIVSGGVSAGDYDFVAECFNAEGIEQVFHKVNIKPGKPLWFGRHQSTYVFGLPGNPVSSFVTARLFVVPLIRQLSGRKMIHDPRVELPLLNSFRGTGDRPFYCPAIVEWGQGIRLVASRGSGDQTNFSSGNALVCLPAHHPPFEKGTMLQVLLDEESLNG